MAIRDLRDDVDALRGVVIRTALRAKLNHALAALAASQPRQACQSLHNFRALAWVQRGKQLTRAQADYLMAQAADIRALIGCR
jgi:hypothetical protein